VLRRAEATHLSGHNKDPRPPASKEASTLPKFRKVVKRGERASVLKALEDREAETEGSNRVMVRKKYEERQPLCLQTGRLLHADT